MGKATLAKAISSAIDAGFSRIQFTPDLLPSDIPGTNIHDPNEARFRWVPGPVLAPVLLADEINRATPRTQSALLEAMAEGQVASDGAGRPLPDPFFVVATQNPRHFHGTYPLPEGQLDRFTIVASMGYPERTTEVDIVREQIERKPLEEVEAVREAVRRVKVHEDLLEYAVSLAEATREHPASSLGVSPRGSIPLVRAARAAARGRGLVGPEDVKKLAEHVLPPRIRVRGGTNATSESIVRDALETVPPPA